MMAFGTQQGGKGRAAFKDVPVCPLVRNLLLRMGERNGLLRSTKGRWSPHTRCMSNNCSSFTLCWSTSEIRQDKRGVGHDVFSQARLQLLLPVFVYSVLLGTRLTQPLLTCAFLFTNVKCISSPKFVSICTPCVYQPTHQNARKNSNQHGKKGALCRRRGHDARFREGYKHAVDMSKHTNQ